MKNSKFNLIIYLLVGIVIGLLVAFVVVLLIKGTDKEKTSNVENTESIEYNDPEFGDLIVLCERLLKDFTDTYFMVGQVNG